MVFIFSPITPEDQAYEEMLSLLWKYVVFILIASIFGFMEHLCLHTAANRIIINLRTLYLKNLLSQESDFYSKINIGSLASEISVKFAEIEHAVSVSLGSIIHVVSMFIFASTVILYLDIFFALISLAFIPLIVIVIII